MKDEYINALRESRAFVRRQLAVRIARDLANNPGFAEDADGKLEPDVADQIAKFAEDIAQALIVRLAAREEVEIARGKMGGTA
jgi:ABC-type arginine transport system ATPase subunit